MSGLDCSEEELRRALGLPQRERQRRIKDVDVQFLSLVPRGANGLPVLFKSDDPGAIEARLAQVESELAHLRRVQAPAHAAEWSAAHRTATLSKEELAGWQAGGRMAALLNAEPGTRETLAKRGDLTDQERNALRSGARMARLISHE